MEAFGQSKNTRRGLRRETEGGCQRPYLSVRSVGFYVAVSSCVCPGAAHFAQSYQGGTTEAEEWKVPPGSLGLATGLRVSYQSRGVGSLPSFSSAEHLPAPRAPLGMVLTGSP